VVIVNGKEYRLAYTIGVMSDYNNWMIAHPKAGYIDGVLQRFVLMVKAYNAIHNRKDDIPKREDMMSLPGYVFTEIEEEVNRVEEADSERQVEAKPEKGKKGESTAK